jgi:uncharacterized protein YgfB (UPF0149 family)
MSIFSNAKDKKKTEFATGIFRNPESGQKLNTGLHASIAEPDLNSQGFGQFGSSVVNGGELFEQTDPKTGAKTGYQEFVQRPKGWTPGGGNTLFEPTAQNNEGTTVTGKTNDGKAILSNGNIVPISMTVDSQAESNNRGLQTPDFMTSLNPKDEQARQDALDAEIAQINADARREVDDIRQAGARKIGSAKSFLAKAGALGRTISGAPVDTNLGVLSEQRNMINDAVNEAYANRDAAIKAAKAGSQEAATKQIEAYNKLIQQNFDNALKLVKEDREMRSEDRADRLADLQYDKLNFDIEKANRDLSRENVEDALQDITDMAESGIPLDQLGIEMINSLETSAELVPGTFEAYYQAKQDAQAMANEENLLKLKKIEADILDQAERTAIARQNANTSSYNASLSARRLKMEEDKKKDNPGDYSEQELRKLRNEGIDPKDTATADDFLYSGDPDKSDIRSAFTESINSGEDLGIILDSLEAGGINPYDNAYKDLTEKAVKAQIKTWIDEKKTESEIRSELYSMGIPEDAIDNLKSEIDKAKGWSDSYDKD